MARQAQSVSSSEHHTRANRVQGNQERSSQPDGDVGDQQDAYPPFDESQQKSKLALFFQMGRDDCTMHGRQQ